MKITNKLKIKEVHFGELDHGDVFKFINDNHVYMRIYEVESDCNVYNAVDLLDGDVTYYDSTVIVVPIYDAELVI